MTKVVSEIIFLYTSILLILFRAVNSQLNCFSHTECDSCTAEGYPQCGWCVVENKCSSQTQCQNSTLNTTVRWTQNSTSCISAIVRPHQLVLDSQIHNLTVSLNSPGLPAPLPGESFFCHLADSQDRFSIMVPAVEVTPSTVFSCDLEGQVLDCQTISAVINLGFRSSLFTTPFGITNATLIICNNCSPTSGTTDAANITSADPTFIKCTIQGPSNDGSVFLEIMVHNLRFIPSKEITVTAGGGKCLIMNRDTIANLIRVICCSDSSSRINVMIGQYLYKDIGCSRGLKAYETSLIAIYSITVITVLLVSCFICCYACVFNAFGCKLVNKRGESTDLRPYNQILDTHVASQDFTSIEHEVSTSEREMREVMSQIPNSIKIPFSQLNLSRTPIGQGEFGVVYKGILTNWNGVPIQPVAIKTVKGVSSSSGTENLVEEIIKMKELNHPHVMTLIGVCLDSGPGVSIVMPFMANGNLARFLRRERISLELKNDSEDDQILAVRKLLLKMCHHIALGMVYLVEQKFVHRDLAARSCMLDSSGAIKVGDFGLAEDVYESGYFRQRERANVKLPFKWMALESLEDAIFTEKTDVWSYGVTVWEIFSGGRIPYPAMNPMSLVQWLRDGNRLERPNNAACDSEIFLVMCQCWHVDPDQRPTFSELASFVDQLLGSVAEYTELRMVLPEPSDNELEYDYVPMPTSTACRLVALGEETSSPPSEDPSVTTNTAYAVSMEEGIVAANSEETSPPLNENSIYTGNSAYVLNRDEGYLVRCSKETSTSSIEGPTMIDNPAYGLSSIEVAYSEETSSPSNEDPIVTDNPASDALSLKEINHQTDEFAHCENGGNPTTESTCGVRAA